MILCVFDLLSGKFKYDGGYQLQYGVGGLILVSVSCSTILSESLYLVLRFTSGIRSMGYASLLHPTCTLSRLLWLLMGVV